MIKLFLSVFTWTLAIALASCSQNNGLGGTGIATPEAKVGSEFRDIFKIDFDSGRKSVPLPPGVWKLVSANTHMSGGSVAFVNLMNFYLIRQSKGIVTGLMHIRTPIEIISSYWNISKLCSKNRERRSWYYLSRSADKNEYCNITYPSRGFRRTYKPYKKVFEYIENRSLIIPNAWVFVRFGRSRDDHYLQVSYALPQENYGFPREQKYSNTESPWSINNIDAFPKKKAFMDKAVEWTRSWKGLVDKGFQNKLRKEEVVAHSRIDGSFAGQPATMRTPLSAHPDASTEGRLNELQLLFDKKIITPEEFRDRRQKILDSI